MRSRGRPTIVASLTFFAFGLAAAPRLRAGAHIAVGPWRVVGALADAGLVVASFLIDADRVLAGDGSAWTGWSRFGAGLAQSSVASVSGLAGRPGAFPGTLTSKAPPRAIRPVCYATDQPDSDRQQAAR